MKRNENRKKFAVLAIMLVFFAGLILGACSNFSSDVSLFENVLYSHLVLKNGNETTEQIKLNTNVLPDFSSLQRETLANQLKSVFVADMFELHAAAMQKLEEKDEQLKLVAQNSEFMKVALENGIVYFVITYKNADIWTALSEREGLETPQIQTGFLTITRIDRQEKIGMVKTIDDKDVYVADYIQEKAFDIIKTYNEESFDSLTIKSSFSYLVEQKRRHSNADEIAFNGGRYFHMWNTTNETEIVFYSVYARYTVWYLFALFLGGLVLGGTLLYSKHYKEKQKPNQSVNMSDAEIASFLRDNELMPEKTETKLVAKAEPQSEQIGKEKNNEKTVKPIKSTKVATKAEPKAKGNKTTKKEKSNKKETKPKKRIETKDE